MLDVKRVGYVLVGEDVADIEDTNAVRTYCIDRSQERFVLADAGVVNEELTKSPQPVAAASSGRPTPRPRVRVSRGASSTIDIVSGPG
jgi:hypothetical protein